MKLLPTVVHRERLRQEMEDRQNMLKLEDSMWAVVKMVKRNGPIEFLGSDITYEVVEVEDEWGWRTFEIKARIVTNERAPERVTTCDNGEDHE